MAFDLLTLETGTLSERGVPMEVIHPRSRAPIPDENGNPVTITLLGRNSKIFRAKEREIRERRQARNARAIRVTQEDLEADEVDLLTAVTTGWTFDTLGGSEFGFSPSNAGKLWGDSRFTWLREAAMAFVTTDANFLAT